MDCESLVLGRMDKNANLNELTIEDHTVGLALWGPCWKEIIYLLKVGSLLHLKQNHSFYT